jgi:hypothetical protein
LPRKGTRKHKNLNVRIHAAGRFLCIFVPLCGYDFAGGWVVILRISVSPAIAGGKSIAVLWLRRCKNDSAFNDSAKNASGWEHCIFCRMIILFACLAGLCFGGCGLGSVF